MVMRWEEMIPGALFLGWGILWVIMITAFWLLVLLGLALAVRWLWQRDQDPRATGGVGP